MISCARSFLDQQSTVEYLERELNQGSVYFYNQGAFEPTPYEM